MADRLAASRIAAHDATTRTLIMLHGIYGRGRNWQTIARTVTSARPQYACWLVDLPHHGDSPAGSHGDTIAGLAADVRQWLDEQGLIATAVLGHSYGGKVALAMAEQLREHPLQVWVIDSTPEAKPPSGSAWGMLGAIRGLPSRFGSRDELVTALTKHGYAVGVGQWMASNLARGEDGTFSWKLDFAAMERLLIDFFNTDLWSSVEAPARTHDIHFVKASESNAISAAAVTRIEAAAGPQVHLHHRPGGHWIHAESPQAVAELLIAYLPE
jgi:pimeloyl-ACP methyl ester carboxylesterase